MAEQPTPVLSAQHIDELLDWITDFESKHYAQGSTSTISEILIDADILIDKLFDELRPYSYLHNPDA